MSNHPTRDERRDEIEETRTELPVAEEGRGFFGRQAAQVVAGSGRDLLVR